MDTRGKIIDAEGFRALIATGEWSVVPGLYDPLTAVQARRLDAIAGKGRRVAAIVITASDALLSAEERAVLVASLRSVSGVTISDPQRWRSLIPQNSELEIFHDEDGERERSAQFTKLVIARSWSAERAQQEP